MSVIDLMLDEENELTFKVNIEGSRPATASCRLVIENQDMNLLFEATEITGDEITVTIPPLKHILNEGERNLSLEVVVDDKLFVPLKVKGNFEKSVSITAEAVKTKRKPLVSAKATLVSNKKKNKVLSEKKNNTQSKEKIIKKEGVGRKRKISDNEIMSIIKALTAKKGS